MSDAQIVPLPGSGDPLELLARMVAAATGEADEVVEAEVPPPPTGTSARAQAVWHATLTEHGPFSIDRMQILEAIADTITQYDRVKADWEAAGSPITSKGSMQQDVEAPALVTMAKLRTQEAALWKQVGLNTDGTPRRRPGRPTRAESAAMGNTSKWGTLGT